METKPNHKCGFCGRRAPAVRFGTRVDTSRLDSLCVRCRFDEIDGRAADPAGIRRDMVKAGLISDDGTD